MTDETFTMPSSTADRTKMKDMLFMMQGNLRAIDDQRVLMKESAEAIEAQFNVPKKISMKLARTLFKDDYLDVAEESDQYTTLFEILFPTDHADVE